MSLRVTVSGESKPLWGGGVAKASPKWANKPLVVDPKPR